jgi:enamine deaminase RidA (YjgF/YER057c/UK114 family)
VTAAAGPQGRKRRGRGRHPPISGLPEIGFKVRTSAEADVRWPAQFGISCAIDFVIARAPQDDETRFVLVAMKQPQEVSMQKSFVRGTWQVKRAYSPCVITQGAGRTLYIAGHTGHVDDSGRSLAGDFDAQFKQTFRNIEKTLAEAGAKLADMVTMTVFLIDARYTTRMTELRYELFGKDFPASAAITVQGFAQPEMMIEVQSIAVTA